VIATMRNRFSLLVFSFAVFFVFFAFLAWMIAWREKPPTVIELPSARQVEKLTAQLFMVDDWPSEPLAEFTVPEKYIGVMLDALNPAETWRNPPRQKFLLPLGELNLLTKQGTRIKIVLLHYGQNPVSFEVDGVICMRGGEYRPVAGSGDTEVFSDESLAFCNLVRDIALEANRGKQHRGVGNLIDQLRRSRGELPPE
jgi:hypothetical protein